MSEQMKIEHGNVILTTGDVIRYGDYEVIKWRLEDMGVKLEVLLLGYS